MKKITGTKLGQQRVNVGMQDIAQSNAAREPTGQAGSEDLAFFCTTRVYLVRLRKGRGTRIPLAVSQRNSGSRKEENITALLKFSCHIHCKAGCSSLGLFLEIKPTI